MVAQVGDCVIMDCGSSGGGYVIMGCDVLLYKRHGNLIHVSIEGTFNEDPIRIKNKNKNKSLLPSSTAAIAAAAQQLAAVEACKTTGSTAAASCRSSEQQPR